MTIPDSLQTIAEISIAFAGFTGLVVIASPENFGPACYISGMLWYLVHAAQQFSGMPFIQPDWKK
ncbi:MAG: hypothetical protein OEW64_08005 [Gammaproteobacteria bacterium]|nr:hypothetical protein [Gammaproteobacteria bacterium]MDH5304027.1 hypothetical protein [Gammaproteobacteria bacterium]MDH5321672.1 hypothetical protein [Gammaproteobacteria bacterium]